jgi:hypothetical protein
MPTFETFRKRMVPLAKAPYVTIQKRGTLSFNASAQAALGSPVAIELLYDPEERVIGVRGVEPTVEHAYPIRPLPSKHNSGFIVSGTAFTKYYGIPTKVSKRWPARMEDGVLCIDLTEPGTEVTSNRSNRKGGEKAIDNSHYDGSEADPQAASSPDGPEGTVPETPTP